MKREIAIFVLVLISCAEHRAEQLPIRTYTTADGLARSGVFKIVRDPRGFLWFCTYDGLSRFDGHEFVNYTVANGLPHRLILKPGTYRFRVRAVSADGLISTEPASIAFTIVPPVRQRWWFITLMVVLLAAVTHLIYRYHTRRLIELERVRTRIATDLHDDIGASLSKIAILSVVAGQELSTMRDSE